jgi:ABC-2 type transport system permease protein
MKWLGNKQDTKNNPQEAKKRGSSFHTKAFRSGGYAILISLLLVGAVIAVNLFVDQVPTTYTKLDTTNQQLFTISQQTTDILKSLNTNVTLYLVAQSGKEDKTVNELLSRYKALSDKITVTYVDPVTSPKFVSKYTADTLADNSVIVESPLRNQVVKNDEIFVYDYSNYYTNGSYDVNFDGENALTSAIDYVTSTNLPVVYTLNGHGETELSTELSAAVAKENMTLKPLSLLSLEAVPEDASCIILYAPTSDIGQDESKKLLTYLENGGHLLLMTDYSDKKMPVLMALMENYGVRAADGIVIEGNANNSAPGYAHYLLPNIQSHEITTPLINGKMYALMPVAQGILPLDSYRSTVTVTSLLKTSDAAYSKPNAYNATTMEKESGDINGPFNIGVAITESFEGKQTKLVWFGTSKFLDSSVNQMVSGANYDLLLNSLGWMTERQNSISIRSKSLMSEKITVPAGDASMWSIAITVLLPLAVIGIGIFVFVKRRKR